jgi:hypothetical protein
LAINSNSAGWVADIGNNRVLKLEKAFAEQ